MRELSVVGQDLWQMDVVGGFPLAETRVCDGMLAGLA